MKRREPRRRDYTGTVATLSPPAATGEPGRGEQLQAGWARVRLGRPAGHSTAPSGHGAVSTIRHGHGQTREWEAQRKGLH